MGFTMLERLYYVIETISVFYIGAYILNKKFKADVLTVLGISVNIIILELVNEKLLMEPFVAVVYLAVFLNFYLNYKKGLKKTFLAFVGTLVIYGGLQLVFMIPVFYLVKGKEEVCALAVNTFAFAIVIAVAKTNMLSKITDLWKRKKYESMVFLECLLIIAMAITVISFKINNRAFVVELITLIILITAVVVFSIILSKEHGKYLLEKKERMIDGLYSDAFKTMISEIRSRQHGFDNHLNAMAGICYTSDSVEEIRNKGYEHYVSE